MFERILITDGMVVDPSRKLEAVRDVLIEGGKIADIAPGLSRRKAVAGTLTIDAKGLWVVPGLVDMHVHLREPGRESEETLATGTMAAAGGGVTTVLAMANTQPVTDSPSKISDLRAKAKKDSLIEVLFAGAVTVGQKGKRLTDFAKLRAAGAAALSDDGRPVMDAGLFRLALERARKLGLLVIDHCEDLTLSAGGCMNESPASRRKRVKGVPCAAETVQVLRDIGLSELTGARVHLAHLSAEASIEAVRQAKKRGVPVTAEACPHHIALSDEMIPGRDGNWKMNPPLRSRADREALLEGLADGTIDAIATDHAPHGEGPKSRGLERAPFGVIGLETSLAVVLTELFHKKILSRRQIVERMSTTPAVLLGLKDRGTLARGARADVALIDPNASWTPQPPYLSLSSNSPFSGRRLKGRVVKTLFAGRIVHAL